MMNTEIKQKWVQALRSGDYQQGKFQLKTDKNEFCCLGVLCDIIKNDVNSYWDGNFFIVKLIHSCSDMILIREVFEYCGLDDSNPALKIKSKDNTEIVESITVLNDSLNYTFEQIADLIEEQL